MKTLEDQMSSYAAYHQDGRNNATHFVGVPAIMLSLFIPLDWLRIEGTDVLGLPLSAALLLAVVVLAYYLMLDLALGAFSWSSRRSCCTRATPSLSKAPGRDGSGSRCCSSEAGHCS